MLVIIRICIIAVGFVTISMGMRYWQNGAAMNDAADNRDKPEST
ncbi:MAG: hypothetical protein NXI04_18045 [Planctomycetaceae bacterium]|nr:hypothetical protein [Planctomycetaceae bacterium]